MSELVCRQKKIPPPTSLHLPSTYLAPPSTYLAPPSTHLAPPSTSLHLPRTSLSPPSTSLHLTLFPSPSTCGLDCAQYTTLNGYSWTRQRFSAEGILEREWLQRRQIIRLRCHDFEPNRLVGVVVKHIAISAGGFAFDFWAHTGRQLSSRDSQFGTVSLTARHRCDISVLPKRLAGVGSQHSPSPLTIAEKMKLFLKRTDFSLCGACRNCYHVFIPNNTNPHKTF